MKEFDATFNEATDGYQPAMPGKYPGHVSAENGKIRYRIHRFCVR